MSRFEGSQQFGLRTITEPSVDKDCLEHKPRTDGRVIQILTCIICSSRTTNARMCPHCSKLSCENCIKEWLEARRPECPHCHKPLRQNELVNLSQLAKEFNDTIEMLTKREHEDEQCRKHKVKMNYYCKSCRVPVCSDCAMIGAEHKGHEFDKLTNIMGRLEEHLKQLLGQLSEKKNALVRTFEIIDGEVEGLRRLKEHKNSQLERFSTNMIERIEKEGEMADHCHKLEEAKLQTRFDALKELYDSVAKKLNSFSKPRLVLEEEVLLREATHLSTLCREDSEPFESGSIASQLVPPYDKRTFIIRDYTEKRKKKDIVYTEIFHSRGLDWRLKIYPNGNENSEDIYISIFVELFGAIQEVGKYKYKVEVINHRNPEMRISREFDSEFELGECWGYNTYAKISALYQEGFVHPTEDYLEVVLHIKSPSFYHYVLDQSRLLEVRKHINEKNNRKLRELKQALSLTSPSSNNIQYMQHNNHVILSETVPAEPSKVPLLELDEICEVKSARSNRDVQSPRINDEEIYSPVICTERMQPGQSALLDEFAVKTSKNSRLRRL